LAAVPHPSVPTANVETAKIERGDIAHTIIATGTVRPEELVEVGSQVTGMIAAFGCDSDSPQRSLDCGSRVRKGEMLAQIDPTIYQAQVDYATASLLKAKADVAQNEARHRQTELDWKRAEKLLPDRAISNTDYDLALTNVRVMEASMAASRAEVQQNEATLRIAETNLAYTTIKSPIDGIVVDRRVAIGQTVVASFNAPGLFLLAKESQQVQVWASVDEADIGYIHSGLPVRFTVNAHGDQVFEGRVTQIRLNPTRREDAVSYTVVVEANASGNMLPYMTANLQFEVDRRPNVLLISNDALQSASASATASKGSAASSPRTPSTKLGGGKPVKMWKQRKVNQCFWVKDGGAVRPIEVRLGASNGSVTEVSGIDVREGMEVCLGGVR
jgi:HlyD family secretion protein